MVKPVARLLAGVLVLLIGGCGTLQTSAVLKMPPKQLPRQVELVAVPFYAQEDYQCGPAALAMAMNAAGGATDPEALRPEVYLPQRQGSLQVEMLAAARRHGMVAYPLAPVLENLLAEVADGTPVIVLQNLAFNWYPVWHYAVVIGYDLDRREVILRSGREQRQALSLTTFERTWARSGYWAMLALPPGRMPRSAEEIPFISAVSALERAGHLQGARSAYFAATQHWPQSLAAQIGAGNTAYRMKNLVQAEADFRRAVEVHPDAVAALNNLAQTLSDLGRDEEALPYAQRAVELGGPLNKVAQETLFGIKRKISQ
ncbi:MAG: PA2778 family cysteine peptidase [Sideroxyarcus sp.]|nr:PA2778 family cysteine peptidase [Sideroxyarcus sp.]